MSDKKVFVLKSDCTKYPDPPFDPGEYFPELDMEGIDEENRIYSLVRKALYGLGMDRDNFGTAEWNPFRQLVQPDDKVVLKPNLVLDYHDDGRQGLEAMVTHASLLRPVIDYILKASGGKAQITICDAPLQSASWSKLINENHYHYLVEYYRSRGIDIQLLDLRIIRSYCNKYGGIEKSTELAGDPKGNCIIDVGNDSCFSPIADYSDRLEITGYPSGSVTQHHNDRKNEYLISRTILESDVFINLPKMKTHKKAGVTLSLKNLIGINADKSWIAHHRRGGVRDGGDEFDTQPLYFRLRTKAFVRLRQSVLGVFLLSYLFSPLMRLVSKLPSKLRNKQGNDRLADSCRLPDGTYHIVSEGSWYRNDTLWRTILDINRCLFFADSDGKLHEDRQRRYLTLLDGIVGMEGEGPMEGNATKAGCLVAAYNPVASDYVAAAIMGMDPGRIPAITKCFELNKYKIIDFEAQEIEISSTSSLYVDLDDLCWKDSLKFKPPKGWQGHIERRGFDGKWSASREDSKRMDTFIRCPE